MIKKDISQENIGILREGFKQYFAEHYAELSHRDVICSDAFFIFREDIGITPEEIFELQDGLEQCREKLKVLFTARNRKNPQSDAYTYGRAIKLLKEYVCGEEELPTGKKAKAQSIRLLRSRKQHDDIKSPCVDEIVKYLRLWDDLGDYRVQEEALDKLFLKTYPENSDIQDVVIKVSALNDFYSTNIFKSFNVAKRIMELRIDRRLAINDVSLVNDIATVEMDNGKIKKFYS